MTRRALAALALLAGLLLLLPCAPARAAMPGSLRFCDRDLKLSAAEEDRLFRFGAIVKAELDRSGERVAILSRSGLDLDRFGIRYSHAGLSLRESANAPWSVRQLYYACDEGRPRLFDQGISGFLLGTEDPSTGYLSVVFLPPSRAAQAEAAGLDNARALTMLAGTYSANAYAFARRYQNCNEWLIELLANAWAANGGASPPARDEPGVAQDDATAPDDPPIDPSLPPQDVRAEPRAASDTAVTPDDSRTPRAQAQAWLRAQGYRPSVVEAGWLTPLAAFIPYVHADDHPRAQLRRGRFVVSMPASIEGFVRETMPGASRLEFCHAGGRVVVHRGWDPIAPGCVPAPGDQVLSLE